MKLHARVTLIMLIISFLTGWVTANRFIQYDPSLPIVFWMCMLACAFIVVYPFRFRHWYRQLIFWYALGVRYEFYCWTMREYDSEPMGYDEWKSAILQDPSITVWRLLTGCNGLLLWKWPVFDMEAVGRFSRFLLDWWTEEMEQRRVES